MAKKLYVGNISFQTTSDDLVQAFSQYGTVLGAQIVSDRETGRSRGFAFVEMHDGGDEAIAALNGAQLGGRTLTVNEAPAFTSINNTTNQASRELSRSIAARTTEALFE